MNLARPAEENELEAVTLHIVVRLRSGAEHQFGPIALGAGARDDVDGVHVRIGADAPYPVSITAPVDDPLVWVEYRVRGPLANFEQVVGPDSGRWFMNDIHPTSFWKFQKSSASRIDDVRMPLYLFTGRDRRVELGIGIIGDVVETDFRLIEPVSNRALNVHTRGVEVAIRRGTDEYPLPESRPAHTDRVYVRRGATDGPVPWLTAMREFGEQTRAEYALRDNPVPASLEPFWCSWVDWASDDINEAMVLENVRIGVDLGVRNFIVDDGWFGPGLDSSYGTPLNIGDWRPDPAKFPDMPRLVRRIGELGGRAIIWCAPHAVGPGAQTYPAVRHLLIADKAGSPVLGETQFYSFCFMNAAAREAMVDVCDRLEREWGFHGAKYDLFNWVPQTRCESPDHEHDIQSNVVGLRLVLAEADRRIRGRRPEYIVELKQNYGTPFLTPYGTCMRAGDAPFDPRTNLLRTLHVQSYTPFSLNDYQTFTAGDGPADVAVAVIKMLAAGIPAYGADFARLDESRRDVIRWHHDVYAAHPEAFTRFRTTDDPDLGVLRAEARAGDLLFAVERGAACVLRRPSLVCNGTYADHLIVDVALPGGTATVRDVDGRLLSSGGPLGPGPGLVAVPPGGSLAVGDFPLPAARSGAPARDVR